jgi:hypothetical protein
LICHEYIAASLQISSWLRRARAVIATAVQARKGRRIVADEPAVRSVW